MKYASVFGAIAVALGFIATAVEPSTGHAQEIGTANNPLVIATGRFHGFLPAFRVADALNEQGIVTEIIEFPSATERLEAVAAGYSHMSYAGLTASVLLRARGEDIVVIATTNEKGRALVASPEIETLQDLVGKDIGVTFGSIEQMSLIALLRDNAINPDSDVRLVNMPATDQPIALNGGNIDAYMGFEPWATFGVEQFGAKVLAYPYDTALGAVDSGVETTARFIRDNADLVQAVVQEHVNAVEFYRENPEEVVSAGVENYRVPEDIMQKSMDNVELTYRIKPESIRGLAEFQVEMGFISQDEFDAIDWDEFINPSFVEAAAGNQ